jgi:hypothetical protein
MLTDREIALAARQLLADELADLAPSDDLLATVRARHARSRRTRRATAAAAALACVAAGAVTAVAATSASQQPKAAQTIVLDNYTFSLSRHLHPRAEPAGYWLVTTTLAGRRAQMQLHLLGGQIPAAAAPVPIPGWQRAYLLQSGDSISLYLPYPGQARIYSLGNKPFVAGDRAVLVITAHGVADAQLLQVASEVIPQG